MGPKSDAGKFLTLVLLVENKSIFPFANMFRRQIIAFQPWTKPNPEGALLTLIRLEERADKKSRAERDFFCLMCPLCAALVQAGLVGGVTVLGGGPGAWASAGGPRVARRRRTVTT